MALCAKSMSANHQAHDPAAIKRVGHSIIAAGADLGDLAAKLAGSDWDMVELDVLNRDGELVIAHDDGDLALASQIRFHDALQALRDLLPAQVRIDVDLKGTGYERAVVDVLAELDMVSRTLISTMETASLSEIRAYEPALALGLSMPKSSRNWLAHPVTRPAAYVMLAHLRRVVPRQAAAALRSGLADAIMAHWGVVTPELAATISGLGKELYVWTIDDVPRLLALDGVRVTGVITNERDLFTRAAAARIRGSRAAG